MKKKVIRLNEQDLENLVKRIIKEEGDGYPEGWTDEMEGKYQKGMDAYLSGFHDHKPKRDANQYSKTDNSTPEDKYKKVMDAYLSGFHDRRPNKSDYGLE